MKPDGVIKTAPMNFHNCTMTAPNRWGDDFQAIANDQVLAAMMKVSAARWGDDYPSHDEKQPDRKGPDAATGWRANNTVP